MNYIVVVEGKEVSKEVFKKILRATAMRSHFSQCVRFCPKMSSKSKVITNRRSKKVCNISFSNIMSTPPATLISFFRRFLGFAFLLQPFTSNIFSFLARVRRCETYCSRLAMTRNAKTSEKCLRCTAAAAKAGHSRRTVEAILIVSLRSRSVTLTYLLLSSLFVFFRTQCRHHT